MQFALHGLAFCFQENTHVERSGSNAPVIGRISIGKVVERNGKRLPEKDDQFTITSQVQGKDGWLLHPLNDQLRLGKEDKLRSIPIRLMFNEPELNFRADYTPASIGKPGARFVWAMGKTASALARMESRHCRAPPRCLPTGQRAPASRMADSMSLLVTMIR